MNDKFYTCERHPGWGSLPHGTHCPLCMAYLENAPAPQDMTPAQRRDEMLSWKGILTVPLTMLYDRLNSLVGRGIYNHEYATNWDGLVDEAFGAEAHPTIEQIQADLEKHVPVIRMDFDNEE